MVASAAAQIEAPSDGVFANYRDLAGLADACDYARRLGFAGKSAQEELAWAREVVDAFTASNEAATSVRGEMVDVPVYSRALALLRRGGGG